jgi:clan AA aspartic protease (TIGR02281 family)
VVANGWIALPTRIVLGGYKWILQLDPNKDLAIEEGILADGDDVGLWRVEGDKPIWGPGLNPWQPEKSMRWVSLSSANSRQSVNTGPCREQGNFLHCSLSEALNESGIFLQENGVVGWTFGNLAEDGYLWIGDNGKNLTPEYRVDDFYRITFADSREEEFAMALGMGDEYAPIELLAAFAKGFHREPKLSEQDTPSQLRPSYIITQMRSLIVKLLQEEQNQEIADIFDAQTLIEISHVPLLIDVIQGAVKAYGHENTIQLTERVREYINPVREDEIRLVDSVHAQLYQDWLKTLVETGDLNRAWRAFESASRFFPDDPAIHLLGVKLALTDNDWAAAEKLLYMRNYPASLSDTAKVLEARISELKGAEGKIVIPFTPGSKNITVDARLNNRVLQKFIVDTGASMVTIPYAALEKLKIKIDNRNPVRRVYTAGGLRDAREVILPSIELGGWLVYDVEALVLDIPEKPEWGLLGLNYLNRFRMNLNSDKGILELEPR